MMVVFFMINIFLSISIMLFDFRRRCIPNILVIGILVMSLLLSIITGFVTYSVINALCVFFVLLCVWFFKAIGGGDVKLISAFTIGIAPDYFVLMLCTIGLFGGIQIVLMFFYSKYVKKAIFDRGVPYGIPISISGLIFSFLSVMV